MKYIETMYIILLDIAFDTDYLCENFRNCLAVTCFLGLFRVYDQVQLKKPKLIPFLILYVAENAIDAEHLKE
jgi:hypothetical protein